MGEFSCDTVILVLDAWVQFYCNNYNNEKGAGLRIVLTISVSCEKVSQNIKQKLRKTNELIKTEPCFFAGLILIFSLGVIYGALGEAIVVDPHDQLDGEIFTYILHAKHFNEPIYFELMNGLPSTGMQMAAPGLVLLYFAFPPVTAFALSTFFVMIVAYLGLFVLLRSFFVRSWIAAITAFLFALLPFYSVYGLSIMGIPALLWLIRRCWCKQERKRAVELWVGSLVFSFFSSLVLSGFAVLGLLLLILIFALLDRKKNLFFIRSLSVAWFLLVAGYLLMNLDLISQALLGNGYVSHKSEYVLSPRQFSVLDTVLFLFGGQQHAISNQSFIVPFAFLGLVASVIAFCKSREPKTELRSLVFLIIFACAVAVFIALFYEAFHSSKGVTLRENLPGSLKAFQFDRLYWLYPTIWYVLLGSCSELLLRLAKESKAKKLVVIIILVVCILTMAKSLSTDSIGASVVKQIDPGVSIVQNRYTWREFFGEPVFDEIKEYIYETRNQHSDDITVVSVGLYPSIALYNGFNCLDGYSNNYPLEYKYEFKEVINGELEKSVDLNSYFNGWGNRCYIFSHELGRSYLIDKNQGIEINDLSINIEKLKEMGCDYVLSSVEINNTEKLGLHLEKSFSDYQNYYSVYLYSV